MKTNDDNGDSGDLGIGRPRKRLADRSVWSFQPSKGRGAPSLVVAWLLHILLFHKGLVTNMVSIPLGTQYLRELTRTGDGKRI